MAGWSDSGTAWCYRHPSQRVATLRGPCTYFTDPATSQAWNKVLSSLADPGYHVNFRRKCAPGGTERAGAVRHAAFGVLHQMDVETHQDLKKPEVLALSPQLGWLLEQVTKTVGYGIRLPRERYIMSKERLPCVRPRQTSCFSPSIMEGKAWNAGIGSENDPGPRPWMTKKDARWGSR